MINRRYFQTLLGASLFTPYIAHAQGAPRVVIVGGGIAGVTAAKYINYFSKNKINPIIITEHNSYFMNAQSNLVLADIRSADSLYFNYQGLGMRGSKRIYDRMQAIIRDKKIVLLESGITVGYDYLILAMGIDFDYTKIEGLKQQVDEGLVTQAWGAPTELILLKQELNNVDDNTNIIITVPKMPFSCPTAPYERACMMALYLKRYTNKENKILILDENADIPMQAQVFHRAFAEFYPEYISYHPNVRIKSVEKGMVNLHDGTKIRYSILNAIAPNSAPRICADADLTNESGWCPINPANFKSQFDDRILVLGDSALMVGVPKTAHTANGTAKIAAAALVQEIFNNKPLSMLNFSNSLFGFIDENKLFHYTQYYEIAKNNDKYSFNLRAERGASNDYTKQNLAYAQQWLASMSSDIFG